MAKLSPDAAYILSINFGILYTQVPGSVEQECLSSCIRADTPLPDSMRQSLVCSVPELG